MLVVLNYKNNFYGLDKFSNRQYSLLKMERHQKEILNLFHKSNNISIIKSRQIGMTSILALYVSYIMLWGNKKNIIICSPNVQMGNMFLSKLKGVLFKESNLFFKEAVSILILPLSGILFKRESIFVVTFIDSPFILTAEFSLLIPLLEKRP